MSSNGREELAAAEHAFQLLAPLVFVQGRDPSVRRVAGHLVDAEVPIGDARDLRQMSDRQDLRALAQPAERLRDCVGGLAWPADLAASA